VITSVSINLDASPSIKVVTEFQLTIEAMLRAAADPITDEGHIPYQIIISQNAKLHGLYITLFVVISCSSGDLAVDPYSQPAVASQLRRHIQDVIMAGDGPSVLFTSEHVIPVLIEHRILASTSRACDSMSTQVGWALRALDRKNLPKSHQLSVSAVSGAENWQGTQAVSSSGAMSSP